MSTTPSPAHVKQGLREKLLLCQKQVEELAARLPDALDDWAAAEQQVRQGMLQIGRSLLQAWSETADARVEAPACSVCQERMRRQGRVSSQLATTLGVVGVRRARYRCGRCGQERYPQDAAVRFGAHAVSRPLAEVLGRLGAQLSFAQASQNLEWDYGVHVAKQTVQIVCEEAGLAQVDREDQQRRESMALPPREQLAQLPDSVLVPEKAYVYADGTMLHAEGAWREIRVARVAAVDAEDRVLAVEQRARFLSCQEFGDQLLLLARRVGYHHARRRAFVADGAHWLWETAALHFPEAVQILDWYHLKTHVHPTAAALHGEGSEAAEAFGEALKEDLWEGRSRDVLQRLRQLRKTLRAAAKRQALRQLITYLENNRERIDYPRYRELGLPVGSGPVEGACKTLVGDRCKQAGMRNWTRRGAEGVLRLRAALQNGTYHALWDKPQKSAA